MKKPKASSGVLLAAMALRSKTCSLKPTWAWAKRLQPRVKLEVLSFRMVDLCSLPRRAISGSSNLPQSCECYSCWFVDGEVARLPRKIFLRKSINIHDRSCNPKLCRSVVKTKWFFIMGPSVLLMGTTATCSTLEPTGGGDFWLTLTTQVVLDFAICHGSTYCVPAAFLFVKVDSSQPFDKVELSAVKIKGCLGE